MDKNILMDCDYYDDIVYCVCEGDQILSECPNYYDGVDEMKRLKHQAKNTLSIKLVKKSVQINYFLMDDLNGFVLRYGGKINE